MRAMRDIRTHEQFEDLCHELLASEYSDYQAIAGEGGDAGIDGFRDNRRVIYQLKFSTQRLRPSEYLIDLDRVAQRDLLREWVLVICRDPTPRLLQLKETKEKTYGIEVTILGRTALEHLLNKHPTIRDKYFSQPAKEATVLRLHKNVTTGLRRIEKQIRGKRPSRHQGTQPPNPLTHEHIKEITKAAEEIVGTSRGKIRYSRIFAMLKNEFSEKNWYRISDDKFPDVVKWMHNFKYGVRDEFDHRDSSTRLKGVIQSQRRELGLSDLQYKSLLFKLTGVDSTTKMDHRQLQVVRDQLNLLLERSK
jgi:hypothetical protein